MNRNDALVVCIVIALSLSLSLAFPLSVASLTIHLTDTSGDPLPYSDGSLNDQLNPDRYAHLQPVTDEVEIIIEVKNRTTVPESNEFTIERVYTEEGQRFMRGSIPISEVRSLVEDRYLQGVRITSEQTVNDGRIASGVTAINADLLHNRNITGENVTVGIIDNDFLLSHPSIAHNVGAYRVFSNTSDWRHGTAVASVVIDTAPNAELHLASIGPTTTPKEYAKAIQWLQRSGADIIVDAGSYYAQPGDGTGKISQIVSNASSETVFVTSTGNYAGRYWAGNHSYGEDASGGSWVEFHNGTQANFLNNGKPFSGTVRLTLRWDGWPHTSTDYDLYLLRKQPGTDAVVAKATGHDGRPLEYLETTVPEGEYYVSIRAVNGSDGTGVNHLELFAGRELLFQSPAGLTAPANAQGVLAVGASENGSVEPFSVPGADVVAPDAVALEGVSVNGGTSFSAPYVAGTAALVLSSNPSLTPKEVRTVIKSSADDIGPDGIDPGSGHGLVNATSAVALANQMSDNGLGGPVAMDVSGTGMYFDGDGVGRSRPQTGVV